MMTLWHLDRQNANTLKAMADKIYIVNAIEVGVSADDASDYIVGYCDSLDEAKAKCAKLKATNDEEIELWNKYGSTCTVGCDCWSKADDPVAVKYLNKMKRTKCPYADLAIEELFYGKDAKSGGFEIVCKNKKDWCCQPVVYEYVIEEIEKL